VAGAGHGPANAALLPHTIGALRRRAPEAIAALEAAALGGDLAGLTLRIAERAGAASLRAIGVDRADLEACADAAAKRPQLANTPPAADRDEILALYVTAF
jgi:alcohol dehydrogenase class IV